MAKDQGTTKASKPHKAAKKTEKFVEVAQPESGSNVQPKGAADNSDVEKDEKEDRSSDAEKKTETTPDPNRRRIKKKRSVEAHKRRRMNAKTNKKSKKEAARSVTSESNA